MSVRSSRRLACVALVAFALGTIHSPLALAAEPCDTANAPNPSLDRPDDACADSNGDEIDGMRCGPVFIAPTGSDANLGTIDPPMAMIGAAHAFTPPRDVYIAEGTYEGTVVLASGVDLNGGYAADWLRAPETPRATIHLGPGSGDAALLGVDLEQRAFELDSRRVREESFRPTTRSRRADARGALAYSSTALGFILQSPSGPRLPYRLMMSAATPLPWDAAEVDAC